MKWYGSINNRILEQQKAPEIEIGTPVTYCLWSDREPGYVAGIQRYKNGNIKAIEVQLVGWKSHPWPDGYSKEVLMNEPRGDVMVFKKARNGTYPKLHIGSAQGYRDPHF
jgi:hypothetical protein